MNKENVAEHILKYEKHTNTILKQKWKKNLEIKVNFLAFTWRLTN